ncbi:hypothetical protein CBM2599_A130018 [Cupriavidus taiwanensis]|nr:hypothetical protein CBM2599_A130018 [Cupriavidus taiwanensis]SOY81972.1 hypothetical protein CBM2600_A120590 [Cupriavidus taiwanensis]
MRIQSSSTSPGGVAEWLCSGLQSRVRRFDSDLRLQLQAERRLLAPFLFSRAGCAAGTWRACYITPVVRFSGGSAAWFAGQQVNRHP